MYINILVKDLMNLISIKISINSKKSLELTMLKNQIRLEFIELFFLGSKI
jgi:hypothetical protein